MATRLEKLEEDIQTIKDAVIGNGLKEVKGIQPRLAQQQRVLVTHNKQIRANTEDIKKLKKESRWWKIGIAGAFGSGTATGAAAAPTLKASILKVLSIIAKLKFLTGS